MRDCVATPTGPGLSHVHVGVATPDYSPPGGPLGAGYPDRSVNNDSALANRRSSLSPFPSIIIGGPSSIELQRIHNHEITSKMLV